MNLEPIDPETAVELYLADPEGRCPTVENRPETGTRDAPNSGKFSKCPSNVSPHAIRQKHHAPPE